MPRKPTSPSTRYPGSNPSRGQAQPDAGARKAAKKVRDLEAMAKQFVPVVLGSSRITAMSIGELLAALQELARAEAFYLSRSKDPRPIRKGKGFTLVFRKWRPGTDPTANRHPNERSAPKPLEGQPQPANSLGTEQERSIRAPR